jgi:predicted metal-dependent hydrolase
MKPRSSTAGVFSLPREMAYCTKEGAMRSIVPETGANTPEQADSEALDVRIIRSARRKKTISAKLVNWYTLEVRAPDDITDAELAQAVDELVKRMLAKRRKLRNYVSDEDLERRAARHNRAYFDRKLKWRSIRFVGNQQKRFGSCSPARGTIRISDRLMSAPAFVLDYVIIHELAHLIEPNHSPHFWELVYRYERTERARGYLMALAMEDDQVEDS